MQFGYTDTSSVSTSAGSMVNASNLDVKTTDEEEEIEEYTFLTPKQKNIHMNGYGMLETEDDRTMGMEDDMQMDQEYGRQEKRYQNMDLPPLPPAAKKRVSSHGFHILKRQRGRPRLAQFANDVIMEGQGNSQILSENVVIHDDSLRKFLNSEVNNASNVLSIDHEQSDKKIFQRNQLGQFNQRKSPKQNVQNRIQSRPRQQVFSSYSLRKSKNNTSNFESCITRITLPQAHAASLLLSSALQLPTSSRISNIIGMIK